MNKSQAINFCEGRIIYPAFINMHVHLGENLFKEINGTDWNVLKYIQYTNKINDVFSQLESEKKWQKSAEEVIDDMEKNNVCGFCAARASTSILSQKMDVLSGYPIMQSSKLTNFLERGLSGFLEFRAKYQSCHCKVGLFLHSLYANDEKSLKLCMQCLEAGAEFLTVHIAEDKESELLERKRYNMSAVATLENYGLLTNRTILVHCGYVAPEDWELIAMRHCSVVVCPISNRFLNTCLPNIYKIKQLNIEWYIGTDGLATGRTLSLIEQARELKKCFPQILNEELFCAITSWPSFLGWDNGVRLQSIKKYRSIADFLSTLFE